MSGRYFRAKIDANHGEVVRALRHAGCFVQSLASIGSGCPDVLVGRAGIWCVMEIKDGNKVLSARKLTKDEELWHAAAARHGLPVFVVTSAEEALEAMGLIRRAA